jgi:hypothetical protein
MSSDDALCIRFAKPKPDAQVRQAKRVELGAQHDARLRIWRLLGMVVKSVSPARVEQEKTWPAWNAEVSLIQNAYNARPRCDGLRQDISKMLKPPIRYWAGD